MPRANVFARQMAGGESTRQVLASNLDTLLIASSCNADWNLHRIERCLALAHAGGIRPVVLLTKLDLIADPRPLLEEAKQHLGETPVFAVSARTGEGLEQLEPYLGVGQTLALVGSSGVGKSTLVNRLTNSSLMEVRAIREDDDRGRHTTTHRQLVCLAGGAMLIDTPGIREVGMHDAQAGLSATFADVEELATRCRFTDCQHEAEPGCAVREGLEAGRIDRDRMEHYRQLLRENAYQARREDVRLQQEQKQRDKALHRRQKDMYRTRKKGRK
jgi:ribosome biogenesis GTPase